jgi:glycosyltransferase involved in cell wall biosynthesis
VDGVSQLIQSNVTGWIVPTMDEHALADTLSQAMANPAKLASLGAAAQTATLPYQENIIYDLWHKLILSVGKNNGA